MAKFGKRILLIAAFFLVVASGSALVSTMMSRTPQMPKLVPVLPLFEVKADVPKEARSAYFEALAHFARENGLQFRVRETDKQRDWFRTDMRSESVVAIGDNYGDDGMFSIVFVPQIGKQPDQALADRLQVSLVAHLSKVEGVTLK